MESSDVMRQGARTVLAGALPANKWWLRTLIVLELIQVGSHPLGESDKELVQKILRDKHIASSVFPAKDQSNARWGSETKKPRAGALDDDAPRASSLPSTDPVTRLFSDTQIFFIYFLAH
ncbi:hypothetical protein PsorP6_002443 [Peronosclerospora sorghi]|uniref:Uncharacterized protein n=1 Tax=Peronosclerospora sorghi TaxID=230839 RepID=A0ACC0WQB5_9STRA|nr:hypothetical protein PsorP6_002443 [Peronosclerospora sorghi]